jgi:signal transduction histidine kinase
MQQTLTVAQYAVTAAFVLLGLLTFRGWLANQSDRSRGFLALALGLLGGVALLSRLSALTGGWPGRVLSDLTVACLLGSGLAVLLFRDSFIPSKASIRRIAFVAVAAVFGFWEIVETVTGAGSPLFTVGVLAIVLPWIVCAGEPVVRFWIAARRRPAVQRARLRSLSAGLAGLVLVLIVTGVTGGQSTTEVSLAIQLVALAAVPLLYVGFAPPAWLRRVWRDPEEQQLRAGIRDLLLYISDRATLANRGLEWGIRLLGADGAALIDAGGEVLAIRGMDADVARQLGGRLDGEANGGLVQLEGQPGGTAAVVPLPLDAGRGTLVIAAGPFTPLFGTDEVARLQEYAANLVLALDRARVTERVANLERSKSQFLSLASHELRSPLAVMGGYLSMLEQGSLGVLKEEGLHAVAVLKARTLEMNMLVDQMLEATRLEDGRLALKRRRVDLPEVIREAVETVRPLASDRHQLSLELPPDQVTVMADQDRLATIVGNLLENAIKYSPNGGLVTCRLVQDDGRALLRVSDQGVGISAAEQARLFTRFGRVSNRLTMHIRGTGLGLFLSRELARQHGGDLVVEASEPELGSTFLLTLPLAVAVEQPPAPPAPPPPDPAQEAAVPHLRVISEDDEQLDTGLG